MVSQAPLPASCTWNTQALSGCGRRQVLAQGLSPQSPAVLGLLPVAAVATGKAVEEGQQAADWSGLQPDPAARLDRLEGNDGNYSYRVRSAHDQMFVVAENFNRGWSCQVDGAPVKIWKAYGYLRALRMPAGDHVVHCRYWPSGLNVGLGVSALGLLLCLGAIGFGWRRSASRRSVPPPRPA